MPGEVVLTGQLGLLSLFDLGQLLMLNGATGEMSVTTDGRRGYLYFVRGQIVNAVDDEYHEGEGAAYRLFTWRTGAFEFRPESPTDSRAISSSTEGLMMEAARRMDEDGSGESTGVADRLARRASSLEALRLAFDSVANQSRPAAEGGASTGSPFELLQSSTDVLLFRPHALPRVRQAGRWRVFSCPTRQFPMPGAHALILSTFPLACVCDVVCDITLQISPRPQQSAEIARRSEDRHSRQYPCGSSGHQQFAAVIAFELRSKGSFC